VHNDLYSVEDIPGVGLVRSVRYPAVAASWGRLAAGPPPAQLPES
jgi:hypothetical protein